MTSDGVMSDYGSGVRWDELVLPGTATGHSSLTWLAVDGLGS